ncbi:hypothetical protein RB620_08015 [Paenibacillus sp. LHD-117]|uniref:hypothetical protein n=1 Tax=Paenibacillus sp. LHD-117 TaxID=3071412 RepID=UPI0027E1855E|nr:hypothetical protein [Paenibacillus sp. LHD-117]MDQ6419375.1 hypothetical protein [Paenibacillus sp. LHD-117]
MLTYICSSTAARYGLATHYTSARYAGIALTGALSFREAGAAACADVLSPASGDWRAEGDYLIGVPAAEGSASLTARNPFPGEDSACRFDIGGRLEEVAFALQMPDGGSRSIVVPALTLANAGTLHIRHEGGKLLVLVDRELAVSEDAAEALIALTVSSSRQIRLQTLEWTALGT